MQSSLSRKMILNSAILSRSVYYEDMLLSQNDEIRTIIIESSPRGIEEVWGMM